MSAAAASSPLQIRLRLQRGALALAVDEQFPAAGIIALHGPSGAGKTSLLRCIAGLERHSEGLLCYGTDTWQDEAQGVFIPSHRRRVGMVFQEARLFDHLSVRDNLQYGLRRTPQEERWLSFEEVVDNLDLTALLKRTPELLSGGERQRVALGRALLAGPRLLLLDEPLSGLDRARKSTILAFLAQLPGRFGIPMLYVSHTLDEVIQLADYLVLLEAGRVSGHGPLADMLKRLDLSLAQRDDAGAVLEAEVSGHDDHYHLTRLHFAGQGLTVSRLQRPAGTKVRLHIHARDVSLTLHPPSDTTILNIVPCRINAIAAADNPAQVLLSLESAGQSLLARVTRKSCDQLGLRPGLTVYAQIKSVALTI
jgi:molybdate transport system ATP-binding protein